ncbi:MAG: hypothetical protein ACP5G1_02905 [Nanopusillaceae archaeon]
MKLHKIILTVLLVLGTLFGLIYAYLMMKAGAMGIYGINDIYGPLSRSPLLSVFLILSMSFLLIASTISLNKDKKVFIFITIYSIITIAFLRYFWPDFANYYYMTDFEDSFGHNLQATYITTNGHIWYGTFSSLQPGFWLTLAEIVLMIFGKTNSLTSPPFYFFIKWYTTIFILISIPVIYITFKLYGLNDRQTMIALIVYLIISPQFAYVISNDYAIIPFALSSGFFIKALKSNKIRDYIIFMITFFFSALNHLLILLWLSFGILGASMLMIILPKINIPKRNAFYIFLSIISLYLLRLSLLPRSFVTSNVNGVLYSINTGLKSLIDLFVKPRSSAFITESVRALPSYTFAVRIKELDYMYLLAIPFFVLLSFSIINKKIEYKVLLLFIIFSGLIAGLQVIGMGGVGWADRLPKDLLPILAFSFSSILFLGENRKNKQLKIKKIIKVVGVSLIIIASTLSLFATYAGYSTVAFPYSEPFGEAGIGIGITNHTSPNFDFYYYVDFGLPLLSYSSPPMYYEFAWTYFIYGVYSIYPNATYLLNTINNISSKSNIVLMTPTDFIFQKTWPYHKLPQIIKREWIIALLRKHLTNQNIG